jgi:hypothetical protein
LPVCSEGLSHESEHAVLGSLLPNALEARANISPSAMEPEVPDGKPVDRLSPVRERLCCRVPSGRVDNEMPWLENVRSEPLAPATEAGSSSIATMRAGILRATITLRRTGYSESRARLGQCSGMTPD